MRKPLLLLFALVMSLYTIGQKTMFSPNATGEDMAPSGAKVPGGVYQGSNSDAPLTETTLWVLPENGGTSSNTRAPGNNAKYQRTEYLITPAEMAASGFTSGLNINSIGYLLQAAGAGTLSGTLNIYLRNTTDATYTLGTNWTTTGFTQVYSNASFSPVIVNNSFFIPLNTAYNYTGSGIYVAWEFASPTGTVGTIATTHYCNWINGSTLLYGYRGTTLGTALTAAAWRPATLFSTAPTFTDVINVTNIFAQGKVATPFATPAPIGVRVLNTSASPAVFDLTITVKDVLTSTTRYTNTIAGVTVAASSNAVTNFAGWTPTISEDVYITATATAPAGETYTANNSQYIYSTVNASTNAYAYGTPGLNVNYGWTYPGVGIFANKYTMNGMGIVTGAKLFIGNTAANTGNTISAVCLNSAGAIVATSAAYVILAGDLNTLKSFTFPTPPSFNNEIYYVGMLTTPGTVQWNPCGLSYEVPQRGGSYYTFAATGGTPSEFTLTYRFNNEAVVAAYAGVENPTAFTATPVSTTQINLSWALNPNSNNVLVAYSLTGVFGTPVNGSTYVAGATITGGGTVLQYNTSTSYNHTPLLPAGIYYYKAWSYDGTTYSVGTITNGRTDCTLTTAPWTESFEGALFQPMCWSVSNTSNAWARSTACSGYGVGTASAKANFFDFTSPTPFDLVTLQFDAAAMPNPVLKFDYAYAAYDDASGPYIDEMDVYYSTDNGATYSMLLPMPGGLTGILNTYGPVSLGTLFVPTAAQWASQTLPLPAGTNKVKFTAISAYGNNLYLDNVKVFQLYAHDVGVATVDVSPIVTVGSSTPMATVTNFGANTESFPVTMTIGAYTSTKTVTALAPFASTQVTFDAWSAGLGDYTINVCTGLTTPVPDMNTPNDCKPQAVKVLNLNKQVYAYLAYKGTGTDLAGPTTFTLATPGTLNSIADQSTLPIATGGTWAMDTWYAAITNTVAPYNLVTMNTTTGARTVIGDMGFSMNGLSYNTANGLLYGITYNSITLATDLYTINMATGASTLVGSAAGVLLINLAINNAGVCYSIDLTNDNLGTINLTTGAFTVVGPLGFNANYAQDMEFDRESGELYMAAEDLSSGWLAWVNQATGASIRIGAFEGGGEITGFAIPYTYIQPFTEVTGTVTGEETTCYNATNTITVGGANPFTVQIGGSATFIAGVKISFMPGTTIPGGASMHGYITTNASYCAGGPPAMPAVIAGTDPATSSSFEQVNFSIFPNPTSGNFTLVQKGDRKFGDVKVEVYGMHGAKVLVSKMIGEKQHEFVTSQLPVGIYFVKVVADDYTETIKLVKTR